jgi:MoxR-like ATPase
MAPGTSDSTGQAEAVYIPDSDLAAAGQVAMLLGRPLLLTGEPGTGKTTFARFVADHLAPQHFSRGLAIPLPAFPLHTFETKSTSVATDLFYRFDSLRRFHAAHDREMSRNNLDYLTFEALGKAILETRPYADVADLLSDHEWHPGPRRSVVLIDEIDKAPRDFPNDLLNEIDQMFFRIPELPPTKGEGIPSVRAAKDMRPIVILTSNSEKNLPAPFLRRCVFHHIRFPLREDSERLVAIVKAHIGGVDDLASSAIEFFYDIREKLALDKLPTTQELIEWIRVLRQLPLEAGEPAPVQKIWNLPIRHVRPALGALGKTAHDIELIELLLANKTAEKRAAK